jgi:hypothetical protein
VEVTPHLAKGTKGGKGGEAYTKGLKLLKVCDITRGIEAENFRVKIKGGLGEEGPETWLRRGRQEDKGRGGGRMGRLRESFDVLFRRASGMVLDLVVRREGLMDTLTEIKRWFLIDQGDYFVMFMDLAGDVLKRSVKDIKVGRIQSLPAMSIQTSAEGGSGGEGVTAGFKE